MEEIKRLVATIERSRVAPEHKLVSQQGTLETFWFYLSDKQWRFSYYLPTDVDCEKPAGTRAEMKMCS